MPGHEFAQPTAALSNYVVHGLLVAVSRLFTDINSGIKRTKVLKVKEGTLRGFWSLAVSWIKSVPFATSVCMVSRETATGCGKLKFPVADCHMAARAQST